jgi:hypothetical protein
MFVGCRFAVALEAGQKPLAEILDKSSSSRMVSGADAFLLYDTYGFPLEITLDAAADRGIKVPLSLLLCCFPTGQRNLLILESGATQTDQACHRERCKFPIE